ncbi:MAG: hypothetical protein AABX39_00335 [Nanoarchaeota archaeon]
MTEANNSYELKGRGFESVRELCADLRNKLNAEGFNLIPGENCTNMDGVPLTDGKAVGLVYLLSADDKNNGVEISVVSDKSAVLEGESFFDYRFSKATVRPFGEVDDERLKNGLVEVLYEQMRRNYFSRRVDALVAGKED